jgi:hypothetical protein
MGMCGSRNITTNVVTKRKISTKKKIGSIKAPQSESKTKASRKNMFYYSNKKSWIIILDFLQYKDLYQAGKLNRYYILKFRFLNLVSRSQELLKKFYINKRLSQGKVQLRRKSHKLNKNKLNECPTLTVAHCDSDDSCGHHLDESNNSIGAGDKMFSGGFKSSKGNPNFYLINHKSPSGSHIMEFALDSKEKDLSRLHTPSFSQLSGNGDDDFFLLKEVTSFRSKDDMIFSDKR